MRSPYQISNDPSGFNTLDHFKNERSLSGKRIPEAEQPKQIIEEKETKMAKEKSAKKEVKKPKASKKAKKK